MAEIPLNAEVEWVQSLSETFADMEGVAIQQTLVDRLVEQLLEESDAQE
jgi:hypothetical protein